MPLRPSEGFDAVREFARAVARVLVARRPDLLTLEQRKDRRGDRVLVDVMRNGYGQTAVPPYAVRARAGAPVSTPIEWDELSSTGPRAFTLTTVGHRLRERGDPWLGKRRRARALARARRALERVERDVRT